MNQFYVRPTDDRSGSQGRYIVRMSREAAKKAFGWRLPSIVVVSYRHPKLENVEIAAIGWLTLGIEDTVRNDAADVAGVDKIIQMDQTLRQALGFDYYDYRNEFVSVARLHGVGFVHEWISSVIGRRLVYCRPGVLQHKDIEKGIVRASNDVLSMVGTKSGDTIILAGIEKRESGEYWMKIWRAAALTASKEYQDVYRELNEKDRTRRYPNEDAPTPDMTARTPDIGNLIGQHDLNTIFIDKDARDHLFGDDDMQKYRCLPREQDTSQQRNGPHKALYTRTVQCAQPLLLYRAPSGAIANEIMAIGIAAAALGLNFVVVLRELFDQAFWSAHSISITAGSILASIMLAFAAAFWKTRAAVK